MHRRPRITLEDQLWLEISKEIRDNEKSRFYAINIAGIIRSFEKMEQKKRKKRKSKEVTK